MINRTVRAALSGAAAATCAALVPVSAAQAQQVLAVADYEQYGDGPQDTVIRTTAGALAQTGIAGSEVRALADFGVNKIYARGTADYEVYASSAWLDTFTVGGTPGTMVTVNLGISVDGLANFNAASDAGFNYNIYALRGANWSLNGYGGSGGPQWYSPVATGDGYERLILEQVRADGGITQADARDFQGFWNYGANGGEPGAFLAHAQYFAEGDYYIREIAQGPNRIEQRFYSDHFEQYNNGVKAASVPYSANPSAAAGRAGLDASYSLLDMAQLCVGSSCPSGNYPGSDLTLSFTMAAGSTFSLASWLYADDLTEGTIDFFNTAKISGVTLSNGGTLTSASGALQALPGGGYGYPAAAPGVPEPATWAMLIGGFALVGAGMRRRRLRPHALSA